MNTVTEEYPFPGVATCYRRAYRLLDHMGRSGHVSRSKGRKAQCHVSPEMTGLIDALNRGDEHTIKATLLDYRYFDIVHESN